MFNVLVVVGIILLAILAGAWFAVRMLKGNFLQQRWRKPEDPILYRGEDEREAAERLLKDLEQDEYHIEDAVQLGREHGLSKRRARELIDHWVETNEVVEAHSNEPGPGRPKRFVGGGG